MLPWQQSRFQPFLTLNNKLLSLTPLPHKQYLHRAGSPDLSTRDEDVCQITREDHFIPLWGKSGVETVAMAATQYTWLCFLLLSTTTIQRCNCFKPKFLEILSILWFISTRRQYDVTSVLICIIQDWMSLRWKEKQAKTKHYHFFVLKGFGMLLALSIFQALWGHGWDLLMNNS